MKIKGRGQGGACAVRRRTRCEHDEKRHAATHLRVADDDARLRLVVIACVIERALDRIDVVAVHTLNVPTEGFQFGHERFEGEDFPLRLRPRQRPTAIVSLVRANRCFGF